MATVPTVSSLTWILHCDQINQFCCEASISKFSYQVVTLWRTLWGNPQRSIQCWQKPISLNLSHLQQKYKYSVSIAADWFMWTYSYTLGSGRVDQSNNTWFVQATTVCIYELSARTQEYTMCHARTRLEVRGLRDSSFFPFTNNDNKSQIMKKKVRI